MYRIWCSNVTDGKPGTFWGEIFISIGELCIMNGDQYESLKDYVADGLEYKFFGPIPEPEAAQRNSKQQSNVVTNSRMKRR